MSAVGKVDGMGLGGGIKTGEYGRTAALRVLRKDEVKVACVAMTHCSVAVATNNCDSCLTILKTLVPTNI